MELQQFVHFRAGQARDPRDAVADFDDPSHLLGPDGRVKLGDVLAQRVGNLGGTNGELCHHSFLFLVVSIYCGFVKPLGGHGVVQRTQATAGRGVEAQIADFDQYPAQ